jgi:NitT/TauT family transport system ATP-binding protein
MQCLDMVQLRTFANAFVHQLSGGMKHVVAIARALAINSKALLMGELFTALDVHTRRILYNQLLQMRQETTKTILFVTHNINEVVALEDRVIIMSPLLANTWKEFTVNLPRLRPLDYPLIKSITKEIIKESKDLYLSSSTVDSHNNTFENEIASSVMTS